VIAMFVSEEHTIEPLRSEVTLLESDDDLPRAQSAINQDSAMIGRHEGAVAGAAAAEHSEAEHEESLAKRDRVHKRNRRDERFSVIPDERRCKRDRARIFAKGDFLW
jgi:hypothetical protein